MNYERAFKVIKQKETKAWRPERASASVKQIICLCLELALIRKASSAGGRTSLDTLLSQLKKYNTFKNDKIYQHIP